MKVICIDGTPRNPYAYPIPEGIELDVDEPMNKFFKDCYVVYGYEIGKDGLPIYHYKKRFIPLSDIDETKLVNNKQEEYALD